MARLSLACWLLSLGCGAATAPPTSRAETSTSNGSTSSATEGVTATEERAAPSTTAAAPFLPVDGDALAAGAAGIYAGRLEARAGTFCEIPERAWSGARTEAWCGPDDQPRFGHGWAEGGAPAWIVTRMRDGAERPYVALPCEGACTTPPLDELASTVRCGELRALETGARAEHQRCTTDADCAHLASMCFDAAVAREHQDAYAAALASSWGACLGPGAGACPSFPRVVRCDAGRCELSR